MSEYVLSAAKGSKKAMTALYDANKNGVYALCLMLLSDSEKAAKVTQEAFNNCWSQLAVKDIKTDKGFERFVKSEAAKGAANILFAKDLKGFKVARVEKEGVKLPEETDFTGDVNKGIAAMDEALSALDPRQRFVYLVKTCGGLGLVYVGQIIVQREAAARFFYDGAVAELSKNSDIDLSSAASLYSEYVKTVMLPSSVDESCRQAIKDRAVFEMPDKRAVTAIVSLIAVVILAIAAFAILKSNFDKAKESGDGSTSATSGEFTSDKTGNNDAVESYNGYVPPEIDTSKTYHADIKIKNYGTVTVKLAPEEAPMTVANFVDLANKGFYNGLTFHRIIEGFMMQGGDPKGNGTGGSDNNIFGEFESNGFVNNLKHEAGVISMARSAAPNSASSQFFIMHENATHLDGDYAAFGKVVSGMNIVDKICSDAEPTDGNGTIPAAAQPVIESITITVE